MKNLRTLAFLPLLVIRFSANAQTETVAPQPKKLQQLYLSVGTGPAVTSAKESNLLGGNYQLNFTGSFGSNSVFRFNFQHSIFTNTNYKSPGVFSYLEANSYHSTFFPHNESKSVSFLYGRKKQVNKLLEFQALAGLGISKITMWPYDPTGTLCDCSPGLFYKPGLLLQTEAMFLPSKFAGLTAGAFVNLTPKLPSAGINLSLNLGMLK